MKRYTRFLVTMLLVLSLALTGCGKQSDTKNDDNINPNLDLKEEVTLKVAGGWEDFRALELVATEFTKKYPNCSIEYEFVQNYEEQVAKRLAGSEYKLDLFVCGSIQKDSPYEPYALNLAESLDLSDTFQGLADNFEYKASSDKKVLYSLPMGAELRGMFVNKTLLQSLSIEVPTNQTELLAACAKLREAGYLPIQGNPSCMGQHLLYPYICNEIVNSGNYEEEYAKIDNCEEGIEEYFRKPLELAYEIMSSGYYEYKKAETELKLFTDVSNDGYARYFLNILDSDEDGVFEKKDDLGQVAFMPTVWSLKTNIEKLKDDYHSAIEYEFILSPVSEEGGFAYLSPSNGFAINKNSDHLDWAVEFYQFLLEKKNNELLTNEMGIIPNNKDAFQYLSQNFTVPENRISELGQMTFRYGFYEVISQTLLEITKGNNPKYMKVKDDGTTELYTFDEYFDNFIKRFDAIRHPEEAAE